MSDIASPGHKLGQMVGNFFEEFFSDSFSNLASLNGLYCDSKGSRPGVRDKRTKVTWTDSYGNPHDLDYVFEKHGSSEVIGNPVAFIELAWRRYTKHSRNKAGEIEGALIHLGSTYPHAFLGAILCGAFTDGSLDQLKSHDIVVLYIPFEKIASAFSKKGIDLYYEEQATDSEKLKIIDQWNSLDSTDLLRIKHLFKDEIQQEYDEFLHSLKQSFSRIVVEVRITFLYGDVAIFTEVDQALENLETHIIEIKRDLEVLRYEIQLKFSNGDRVEGSFSDITEASNFLRYFS